jgi:hypothetical protein
MISQHTISKTLLMTVIFAGSLLPTSEYFFNHSKRSKNIKPIGGKGMDEATAVLKTKDNNYVIIGRSSSYGAGDMNMNMIKVDASGNVVWNKNYGAEESENAYGIIETAKGGLFIAGYSDSYGAGPDLKNLWVVHTDEKGNKVWEKTFGKNENIEEAASLVETDDNNILVVGTSMAIATAQSNAVLLKIGQDGKEIWRKEYGGAKSDHASKVIKVEDGFIVVGHTESMGKGKWDIWLFKVDKEGNMMWQKSFGGGDNEMGNSVAVDKSGNLFIAGFTYTFAEGSLDAWLIKADSKGNQIWAKNVGDLSTDEFFDVIVNDDGTAVAVGYTDIYKGDPETGENISPESNDVLVVKFDAAGKIVWKKNFGGAKTQQGKGIAKGANGGYVITGYTNQAEEEKSFDMFFLKLDENGNAN